MTGTGVMAAMAVVGTGVSVAQAMKGPPKMPSMGALPKSNVGQVSKQADKETANMIKSSKLRSGAATPNTLLTGSQGVADEELNLGGSRLV
tara:strand:+ start:348 stop:620 length:273 start_codon:yes stop_codon:yes gene_type:complete